MKRPWVVKKTTIEPSTSIDRIKDTLDDLNRFKIISSLGYNEAMDINGLTNDVNLDMYKPAIEFIDKMISLRKTIVIYGDMDFDGMSSTAILYLAISQAYPTASVKYLIPTRDDGHGVDVDLVVKSAPVSLSTLAIITVDNGISSGDEIAILKSKGCEVCVTDHHLPGDKVPVDCPIVNPKYTLDKTNPEYEVPGAYVAGKIAHHLLPFGGTDGIHSELAMAVRVYVAMAIVSDAIDLSSDLIANQLWMGLVDINYTIYKRGLYTSGIEELFKMCGCKGNHPVTTRMLAYSIIPKLNSAGRMNVPHLGVDLMIAPDRDTGMDIAQKLIDLNKERKYIEEEIYLSIQPLVETLIKRYPHSIVVNTSSTFTTPGIFDYAPGVVGIIASRLAETYGVPTLVLYNEGPEVIKGSGRTSGEFDLYKSLSLCSDILTGYGGHKQAAGISLPSNRFNEFQEKFDRVACDAKFGVTPFSIDIDEVTIADLQSVYNQVNMSLIEPIGNGNETLIMAIRGLVLAHKEYNEDRGVLSLIFKDDKGDTMVSRKFKPSPELLKVREDSVFDVLVSPAVLYFTGATSIDWTLVDVKARKGVSHGVND